MARTVCSTPAIHSYEMMLSRNGSCIPCAATRNRESRAGIMDSPPSRPYCDVIRCQYTSSWVYVTGRTRFRLGNLSWRNLSRASLLARREWMRLRSGVGRGSSASRWRMNHRRSALCGECMYCQVVQYIARSPVHFGHAPHTRYGPHTPRSGVPRCPSAPMVLPVADPRR